MRLYSIDIEFMGRKTPENLTQGNYKNMINHLTGFKHRCSIKFKTSSDLEKCIDTITSKLEHDLNRLIYTKIINRNILVLTLTPDGGIIC